MKRKYTVAMVFATDIEMSAFRYMLDEEYKDEVVDHEGNENQYILGRVHEHNVVLAFLDGQQGTGAAAGAAVHVARTFPSIRWHILVGVGGGVTKRHDIRLGDVVVSMPSQHYAGVAQYGQGRRTDGRFELKGFLAAPPPHLRSTAQLMKSNKLDPDYTCKVDEYTSKLRARGPELNDAFARPADDTDILFEDGVEHNSNPFSCDKCDKTKIKPSTRRPGNLVKVHYGLIASGDVVVMNTKTRDHIMELLEGDVLCFEMEAAGIMANYPCMVIRGISDYADSHKNEGWQAYAAANAAAVAKELLSLARPDSVEYEVPYENQQAEAAMRQLVTQYRGQITNQGSNSGFIIGAGDFSGATIQ